MVSQFASSSMTSRTVSSFAGSSRSRSLIRGALDETTMATMTMLMMISIKGPPSSADPKNLVNNFVLAKPQPACIRPKTSRLSMCKLAAKCLTCSMLAKARTTTSMTTPWPPVSLTSHNSSTLKRRGIARYESVGRARRPSTQRPSPPEEHLKLNGSTRQELRICKGTR